MLETDIFRHVVVVIVVLLVLAAIYRWTAASRPMRIGNSGGRIRPHLALMAGSTAVSLIVASLAFYAAATDPDSYPAILVGWGMLAAALATGIGLLPVYILDWDENGVDGPASAGLPIWSKRAFMRWDEIVGVGQDAFGNLFIENASGTRIRWNYFYKGYRGFMDEVVDRCPHLFPEPTQPV